VVIALDTTFLLDYLDGEPAAGEFLESRTNKPVHAPSLALFETYRGAATSSGSDGLYRVTTRLDWIEPLAVTDGAAREAVFK